MDAPDNPAVAVQLASDDDDIPSEQDVTRWVAAALAAAGDTAGEVTVRIVDDEEMQALNRDYRDKDRPTNVLSFPAEAMPGLPSDEAAPLGDLVVCAPVVRREAREQDKAPGDHWAHMLVHGTLHLLGHDHENDVEAAEMEAAETRILAAMGVADPYRV